MVIGTVSNERLKDTGRNLTTHQKYKGKEIILLNVNLKDRSRRPNTQIIGVPKGEKSNRWRGKFESED